MHGKRVGLALLAAALTLLLSGCFVKTVDELYTLPRHSDEYDRLELAIDAVLSGQSAAYSAPVSGPNQQSVQLADLDGDGQEEAIAFLKAAGDRPLRACIFSRVDGDYHLTDVIEGDGTSFASVEYVQLTDQPGIELVIGRQLSTDVLQSLSAYSYSDGHVAELMNANYSEYRVVDLDGDGRKDIFLLRFEAEQPQGIAELYRWKAGQMEREKEAYLTAGASLVKRILTGNLMKDIPAVFVSSAYEDTGLVTDVFAFQNGVFQSVTMREAESPVSTVRSYYVYASDIDGDGLIELPQILPLPSAEESDENDSAISWYNLDLDGRSLPKLTTYHSFSGGWFLKLPDRWQNQFCITRGAEADGVHGYAFSQWEDGRRTELIFTIYAFSGENRNESASADGSFWPKKAISPMRRSLEQGSGPRSCLRTGCGICSTLFILIGIRERHEERNSMKKVLILEDEVSIRSFVVINLKRAGYEVVEAGTGEEALDLLKANPDVGVAILDIMLPGIDGFEVCRSIRATDKKIGIIMLTARSQEMDKITGLMTGADDYMTKPFSPAELTARIDALYRRIDSDGSSNQIELKHGPFVLNTRNRTLDKEGRRIKLTQVEYAIVKLFMQNPGRALSREDILAAVWGRDYDGELKIVDVNIRRLRIKIEDDTANPTYITTVWGFGYKWGA